MTYITIISAMASRISEDDPTVMTSWSGEADVSSGLEDIFRFFNRVTMADNDRLEALGYKMPSLSVGDLVTTPEGTFQVQPVGFVKVDPPKPCGYCRRCALHDDPGGCLEVYAWERETLGVR